MLLWVFSLAAQVYNSSLYRDVAEGILKALQETFLENGLFCAAHDADTGHSEGATYLWSTEELRKVLSPDEYNTLEAVYLLPEEGNFEGRIHLLRREPGTAVEIEAVEEKLLSLRKTRPNPLWTGINLPDGMLLPESVSFRPTDTLETRRHLKWLWTFGSSLSPGM